MVWALMGWIPVSLPAEWTDPSQEDTVNVGNTVHVVALWMPDFEPDEGSIWHGYPKWALIVRRRYLGSDHHPAIVVETECVKWGRISLLLPYG
jgi:hypothetical protein